MATRKKRVVEVPDHKDAKQVNIISSKSTFINRKYYKLNDAVKFASLKIPNITIEDLIHCAVLGDIRLLIHVPSWCNPITVNRSDNIIKSKIILPSSPKILELSIDDCMAIEINGKVKQRFFKGAYSFVGAHALGTRDFWKVDIAYPCNEWDVKNDNEQKDCHSLNIVRKLPTEHELNHQSKDSNIKPEIDEKIITKSMDSILITINSIILLAEDLNTLIDKQFSLKKNYDVLSKPQRLLSNSSLITGKDIEYFRSFVFLSNDTPGCNPLQLLRRAIQRNVTLYAIVPEGIHIYASNFGINSNYFEYMWKPQIIALKPIDCENIFNSGEFEVGDFSYGYFIDDFGQLKKITPYDEQPDIPPNIQWRTFRGGAVCELKLNCRDLIAMSPDVRRLTSSLLHQDDLTFDDETNKVISSGRVLSLEDSVEIIKSRFVDCTLKQLMYILISLKKFDILTPIPAEISIKKKTYKKEFKAIHLKHEVSTFLILFHAANILIAANGYASVSGFKDALVISLSKYEKILEKSNETIESSLRKFIIKTYDDGHEYKLPIKLENVYINRSDLNLLMEATDTEWDYFIEKLGRDEIYSYEINFVINSINKDAPQNSITNASESSGVAEVFAASEKLVDSSEVQKMLNIGRSTLCNLNNIKSKYYNKEFPKPTREGNKKFWKTSEIDDYKKKSKRRGGSEGAPTDDRPQGSI